MSRVIVERVQHDNRGVCWEVGIGGWRHNFALHLSLGGPVWWRPTVGRLRYSGIVAIQIAAKPRVLR